ncbi:MAG: hypothetical protein JSV05_01375 [Candidatus Bathyarchaeota archaeon]|nr:MAG: hypothetical protein JSV05_01375 [Candidatus Bathyarchaeota archaeon]
MNKTLSYVILALLLGLTMILGPTWFFLVRADQNEISIMIFTRQLPLIDYTEQNHIETISFKEAEVLSISFVVALVVFILFKRRSPDGHYSWLPPRPY